MTSIPFVGIINPPTTALVHQTPKPLAGGADWEAGRRLSVRPDDRPRRGWSCACWRRGGSVSAAPVAHTSRRHAVRALFDGNAVKRKRQDCALDVQSADTQAGCRLAAG